MPSCHSQVKRYFILLQKFVIGSEVMKKYKVSSCQAWML